VSPAGWILYVRAGCHLCEQFLLDLSLDHPAIGLEIPTQDVDGDAELATLYGLRVPVLVRDGQVVCEGVYDASRVEAALRL
jgi:hypothetical protein